MIYGTQIFVTRQNMKYTASIAVQWELLVLTGKWISDNATYM